MSKEDYFTVLSMVNMQDRDVWSKCMIVTKIEQDKSGESYADGFLEACRKQPHFPGDAQLLEEYAKAPAAPGMTVGTICHYANEHSPEEYAAYKKRKAEDLLQEVLQAPQSDKPYAELFLQANPDRYIYADGMLDFGSGRWVEVDDLVVKNRIAAECKRIFKKLQAYIHAAEDDVDEDDKEGSCMVKAQKRALAAARTYMGAPQPSTASSATSK